jgi:hypothetical protein
MNTLAILMSPMKVKLFSYTVSHTLLDLPGVRRFQFRHTGCAGKNVDVQPLPIPGLGAGAGNLFPPIIALVGFKLYVTRDDIELERIGIWFRGKELHVEMRNTDGDNTFGYLVDFAVIPTGLQNVSIGSNRGSGHKESTVNIPGLPGGDFLLSGWRFRYTDGDHHLLNIGVLRSGDDVIVNYADEGGKEPFDWVVEWTQVGRRMVAPEGSLLV